MHARHLTDEFSVLHAQECHSALHQALDSLEHGADADSMLVWQLHMLSMIFR